MLNLRKVANQVFGGKEEMDEILELPIMQLRMELKAAFDEKKFNQEQYDDFISRLAKVEDSEGKKLSTSQINIARKAVDKREVETILDIELNSPAKQLLWAATLTRMQDAATPENKLGMVEDSRLWSQLQATHGVNNESIMISRIIISALQNKDVTFGWGTPGTWFYNDPSRNHVNMDLYLMLLSGFEHIRAVMLHEIGHSQVTNSYPAEMNELYKKIKDFIDPTGRDGDAWKKRVDELKVSKQKQKELALDIKKWQLMFGMFNCLEDICVDQFAVDTSMGGQMFDYSLNHAAILLRGFGRTLTGSDIKKFDEEIKEARAEGKIDQKSAQKQKENFMLRKRPLDKGEVQMIKAGKISPEIAEKMFQQIIWGGLKGAYNKHNLFIDKDKSWERLDTFKQDINDTVDMSVISDANGRTPFQYLYDICNEGRESIRLLQPSPEDKFLINEGYNNIEDSYRAVVKETTEKRMAVMQKIWDIYLKPYADVLMKQFEKEVEQQLNQKPQQGQGDPQQGQGQGDPQQGSGGGGSQSSGAQDIADAIKKAIGDMSENPGEARAKEKDKNQQGTGNDNGKDKNGKGGPGWGHKPQTSQGQKPIKANEQKDKQIVDEKMSDAQKQAMRDAMKNAPPADPNSLQGGAGAGKTRTVDLASNAKGDWREFAKRMFELSPIVNQVSRAFAEIRRMQRRPAVKMGTSHDFMADDGDFTSRLDRDRMLDAKFRRATGQAMKVDDFKKFKQDDHTTKESSIELVFGIDGSGSMQGVDLGNGVRAIDCAVQSAAIGYMAARKAGIKSYIIMWGDDIPLIVARPDTPFEKVGEALERFKNGTNSGTSLAPGITEMVKEMSAHKEVGDVISGSSHMFFFSDGDIYDPEPATEVMKLMCRHGKNITADVAVLKTGKTGKTSMETVIDNIVKTTGGKQVGLLCGSDPQRIALDLAKLALKRVRSMNIKTEPDSEKRKRLKQLHKKLTNNN